MLCVVPLGSPQPADRIDSGRRAAQSVITGRMTDP